MLLNEARIARGGHGALALGRPTCCLPQPLQHGAI